MKKRSRKVTSDPVKKDTPKTSLADMIRVQIERNRKPDTDTRLDTLAWKMDRLSDARRRRLIEDMEQLDDFENNRNFQA